MKAGNHEKVKKSKQNTIREHKCINSKYVQSKQKEENTRKRKTQKHKQQNNTRERKEKIKTKLQHRTKPSKPPTLKPQFISLCKQKVQNLKLKIKKNQPKKT
ncbi:hypothetical protein HYD75_00250 [Mycoplasmopsis bovis]|nr:hypothetical protein [Mycoplasmopsis bovis]QQH48806.1 hypothetical protein HYD75_00250 [Mycoplasmopsis bovis]